MKCNYHLSCKHFERVLLVFRAREKNGAGELLCQGGHTPVHRSQTFRRAAHLLQGTLGATSGDKPLPVHNSEFSVTNPPFLLSSLWCSGFPAAGNDPVDASAVRVGCARSPAWSGGQVWWDGALIS